jgi:energy-coupling factor transport system ATP-binding protein
MSLVLRDVTYRYAGATRPALDGVSLDVPPGRVVGVIGTNGAGKSTLAIVAAGLAPATIGGRLTGEVSIEGLVTAEAAPHAVAQRCGILFQNPSTQLSGTSPTVWEEVAFGPRNLGLPLPEVADRVWESLDTLGIASLAERDPERLSGGQAQLVALAGVLALRPAYLVLDEPTSQLDPRGTELVAAAIARVTAAGRSGVLVAEHKTDMLQAICDHVVAIDRGKLVASGAAADVLADPDLTAWGAIPPASVRLHRAAREAGVVLPETGA